MKYVAGTITFALLIAGNAVAAEPKYAGFDVTDLDDPRVSFNFSAGDATSASPIVISAPGRRLTNDDRTHRTDLQKHWLSFHVPKDARLVSRALVECEFKRRDEFAACDRYVFEDPESKQELEYYIYVGNWP